MDAAKLVKVKARALVDTLAELVDAAEQLPADDLRRHGLPKLAALLDHQIESLGKVVIALSLNPPRHETVIVRPGLNPSEN